MAPEQFWWMQYGKFPHCPTSIISIKSIKDNASVWFLNNKDGLDPHEIGRFFLDYAYSTPAGTAYRLAYGISNPSTDNEAGEP